MGVYINEIIMWLYLTLFGTSMLYFLIFIIVVAVLAIVSYVVYMKKIYKYKIQIFENYGGKRYVLAGTDTARLLKIGDGGEMILKLRRRKC